MSTAIITKKHIIAFQFYDRDGYSGGPAINVAMNSFRISQVRS